MSSYASGAVFAKEHPMGRNICGIGTAPEGIGTVPVVYDMVYDMAWRTDSIQIPQWLTNYTYYRYGMEDTNCDKAWKILSETVYECHNELGGPVESLYLLPVLQIRSIMCLRGAMPGYFTNL